MYRCVVYDSVSTGFDTTKVGQASVAKFFCFVMCFVQFRCATFWRRYGCVFDGDLGEGCGGDGRVAVRGRHHVVGTSDQGFTKEA